MRACALAHLSANRTDLVERTAKHAACSLQVRPGARSQPPSGARRRYKPPHWPNTMLTKPGVEHLEPQTICKAMQEGMCVLVDLRGEDRSADMVEGAVHTSAVDRDVSFVSKVPDLLKLLAAKPLVVFTCQYSAHRAPQCANWYRGEAKPSQRVAILSGSFQGLEANRLLAVAVPTTSAVNEVADSAMADGANFVKQDASHILK